MFTRGCRGEGIKLVVSDNASVGKYWLTCIALPQYFVDQGLADIVVVVFLENNHGKWLADQLFGQFQIRKSRCTVLGIDGLLREFESINRKNGTVRGFAVNPLSSVNIREVFSSLGYSTKPPSEFCFTKRNIHFASACAPGAAARLSAPLRSLFGDLLPTEQGMVRVCSYPLSGRKQNELPFESRYVDVPAAAKDEISGRSKSGSLTEAPLIVSLSQPYAPKGSCVVSNRTARVVGFNGISFRGSAACPELSSVDDAITREAWPARMLRSETGDEPLPDSEYVKCAPENWICRQPVCHFGGSGRSSVARYPPRNLLNARFEKPPRHAGSWVPTATYSEPPFPFLNGRSASEASQQFAALFEDKSQTPHVLNLLRCVYSTMEDHSYVSDPWLQRRVTKPHSRALIAFYEHLTVYMERERFHPKPAITIRQAFYADPDVNAEVTRRLSSSTNSTDTRSKVKARLFEAAEKNPGALEKFRHIAEKDLERYAREMRIFKEVTQRKFDEENGLLPVEQAELT